MADYTQITFFAPKDALGTGNPSKLIKGSEVDPELAAISTAIATKFDSGDVADNTAAAALASDGVLITPAKLKYAVENGTILYNFNALTALGSAADTTDYVPFYDVSASTTKKITVANLIAGTGYVPNARTITAGTGLTGGGDFSADRTLNVGASLGIVVNADSVEVDEGSGLTFSGNQLVVYRNPSSVLDGVGYMDIPVNSINANYTAVMTDRGKAIIRDNTGGAAVTVTIPANGSVAYPTGSVLTFINRNSVNVTIAITTDTLIFAGTNTTGSRTLIQHGWASAVKMDSTTWIINGVGLA